MATAFESLINVRIRAIMEGLPHVARFSKELKDIKNTVGGTNFDRLTGSVNRANTAKGRLANTIRNLTSSTGALRSVSASAGLALSGMGRAGSLASTALLSASGGVYALLAALVALAAGGALALFAAIGKTGVEFNAEVQATKIGLAGLLTTLAQINDVNGRRLQDQEKFNAALLITDQLHEKILAKSLQTTATSDQLLQAYQQALPSGLAANLDLDKILDLTTKITQAAGALNIPMNQLNEEIRNLLSGNATRDSRVAVALFGSPAEANRQIQQAKQLGTLYEFLNERLKGIELSGRAMAKTFGGAFTNIKEAFQVISGKATDALFDKLTQAANKLFGTLVDPKALEQGIVQVSSRYKGLFDFLEQRFAATGDLVTRFLDYILGLLDQVSAFFGKYNFQLNEIADILVELGSQVLAGIVDVVRLFFELLGDIFGIVGSITGEFNNVNDRADKTHNVLAGVKVIVGGLAVGVGIIRDGLSIIVGLAQTLAGVLTYSIASVLNTIVGYVNTLINKFTTLIGLGNVLSESPLEGAKSFGQNLISSGGKNIFDAIDRSKTLEALNAIATAGRASSRTKLPGLRSRFGGSVSGSNASKESENAKKDRRARQQALDAERDLLRNQAESTFRLVEDLLDRTQKDLDNALEDNLTAITDYYSRRLLKVEELATKEGELLNTLSNLAKQEKAAKDKETNAAFAAGEITAAERQAQLTKNQVEYEREKLKINERVEIINRNLNQAYADRDRDQRIALRNFRNEVKAVEADIYEMEGRTAEAAASRIDEQFRTLREKLTINNSRGELQGQLTDQITALDRYIALLKQKARFEELSTFYSRVANQLQIDRDTLLRDAERTGESQYVTERKIYDLELQRKALLGDVLAGLQRIANETGLPELLDAVAQLNFEFENLAVKTNSFGVSVNNLIESGLGNFFNDLIDGASGLGENFRKAASGMLLDLAKLIFQATVFKSIMNALGLSDKSGTKGIGGFFGRLFGFAEGGVVNGPGTGTSDSIPAWLSAGEYVMPAHRVSQLGVNFLDNLRAGKWMSTPRFATGGLAGRDGGASSTVAPGQGTRVVNLLDPNLLQDYINTAAGERVLLNVISRNPAKVKQMLGMA